MTSPCDENTPDYFVEVDWYNDGTYVDQHDDISGYLTMTPSVQFSYGRDDARSLTPLSAGTMNFELCDSSGLFSPENSSSPLMNDIQPARPVRVRLNYQSTDFNLFDAHIDDFNIETDHATSHVPITVLDGIAKLQGVKISTPVHEAIQTGEAVNLILDEVGWDPDKRQIDVGATTIPWWWEEEQDAFIALERVVYAEGPPAIAYIEPSTGDFIFRSRHHRILDPRSNNVQAAFCVPLSGECASDPVTGVPCPDGSLGFTEPFQYDSGWRNIINQVTFTVQERRRSQFKAEVWRSDALISTKGDGSTTAINMRVSGDSPVLEANELQYDNVWGPGVLTQAQFNRDSGQSVTLFLASIGGPVYVEGLRLLGYTLDVVNDVHVTQENSASVSQYGVRSWPNVDTPFLNANDASDVASRILSNYADRSALVTIRVVMCDTDYLDAMLNLRLGDMVTIHNPRMSNDPIVFTIERIAHDIRGKRMAGHAVTYTCLQRKTQVDDPFTFDVLGLGFDDGHFGLSGLLQESELFIFDREGQGFNEGKFAY